jgi:hypothetical protein
MQYENKSKSTTNRIYKMSPHHDAVSGVINMSQVARILIEKYNSGSVHVSRKELGEMIQNVQSSLKIHLRAFAGSEATNSTSREKATDGADGANGTTSPFTTSLVDPSASPFDEDTLDYKNWKATEMTTVLEQLKLDISWTNNVTKELWDVMVRQAKAVLIPDMNLNPCVITIGIILFMLDCPESLWTSPQGQLQEDIWIRAAAMYNNDDKISAGGVLEAIPVLRVARLRKKLNNYVALKTVRWPWDVRRRVLQYTLMDVATVMFSREDIDMDTVNSVSPTDIWLATRWADEAKRMNRDICDIAREFNGKVPEDLQWDVDIVYGYMDKRQNDPIDTISPNPKRKKTVVATDETVVGSEQPEANTSAGFITTKVAPTNKIATENSIYSSAPDDTIQTTDFGDTTAKDTDSQIQRKARSSPSPSLYTSPPPSPEKSDLDIAMDWVEGQRQHNADL